MWGFLTILFLPSLVRTDDIPSRISVVCPEVGVPGQSTAVLVSLHRNEPTNVTLRLAVSGDDTKGFLAHNTVTISGEGTVGVPVPSQARGEVTLETMAGCRHTEDPSTCQPQITCVVRLVGPIRDVITRPKSRFYKPGEKIEFWVIPLDHDLRVASDIIGSVYVKTPRGIKVAIWEQIPLDRGISGFETVLSPRAEIGLWSLEAVVDGASFSTSINVSLARGSSDPVAPEQPIAEEHFVELSFSKDMRRRYKPGLPFVGKVEAVSSEKAVRVRVKVLDNTTSIYSQDIEMAGGEGSFLVPAVLSDSDLIILQAELVSVEGKEIDLHYVLAREPIYKWNSTTSCYLLAEGMEASLKPGDLAQPVILSSCPCDRNLHYIVTTEGSLTYWDEGRVPAISLPPQKGIPRASLCRYNLTFKIEAVMAPVSHLLVYYVTDDGEPIRDVISFSVKLLQRQVAINLKQQKFWYPDSPMDVQVSADSDALVYLVGGRGGELHSRSIGNVELDFTEAGVGFYQWNSNGANISSRSKLPRHHHSIMSDIDLDQLWLWKCINYTKEIEVKGLTIKSPPDSGLWTLFALSVSPTMGLRYSAPVSIYVFRPLEVDYKLPSAFRVGESLEVDIKIGNNLNSCVDVNALLTLSQGAHFLGSSQPFVAEKLRLGPHGATSLVVRIGASAAGHKNLTVEVSAFHSATCQSVATAEENSNHSLVGTVLKQERILVNPEGLVKTHIESAYFCANEQMVLSTMEDFKHEFIPAPRNREGLVFEVKAGKEVHIALSEIQDLSQRMYHVIIGDQENKVSWLGRGKHGYSVHLVRASTPNILSSDESRTFWLSWDRGALAFGTGPVVHEKSVLKWRMDKRMRVNYIGFATNWGRPAEFRIWNFNDEAGFSQVIHLDIPHSVLPGSETGTLLIAGGLYLPYLANLNRPSLSEYSSLATVISTIAPYVTDNASTDQHSVIKVDTGLQNLLQFRNVDGSFSDHRSISSLRLSVEVLDLLRRAQKIVAVDPDLISQLKTWIIRRQGSNGGFKFPEFDLSPDNETRLTEPSASTLATAVTLVSLLDTGIETENDSEVIDRARNFLETEFIEKSTSFDCITLAAACHALVLSRSLKVDWALEQLKNASTNEEGEFGWPRLRDNTDWLYEEGVEQRKPVVFNHLKEFTASLYTLMTYTALGDLKAAEPVARYLFYRSNTLDTHTELTYLAVRAFSDYGHMALDANRWLTVSLATSGMELTDTLELRAGTAPQLLNLPSLPTKVFVYATGGGCATVQGRISFATYSPSKSHAQFDLWAGVTEEILPRRNSIQELEGKLPLLNLKTCFSWKGTEPVGVVRLEVHMFSGFELLSVAPNSFEVEYGSRADRVWFSVANVTSGCAVCISFSAKSDFIISRLRPALARVYPAGRADLASEMFFHTRKGSPLLSGTSNDDMITWFGSSNSWDSDSTSSDFTNVCPCGSKENCEGGGRVKSTADPPFQNLSQEDSVSPGEDLNDFTDIIVFSDLHENLSTTEGEYKTIEDLTRELVFNTTSEITHETRSTTQETFGIKTTSEPTWTTLTSTIVPKLSKTGKKKFLTTLMKNSKENPGEKGLSKSTNDEKTTKKETKDRLPQRKKHVDLPPKPFSIEMGKEPLNKQHASKASNPPVVAYLTTEPSQPLRPLDTARLVKEESSQQIRPRRPVTIGS